MSAPDTTTPSLLTLATMPNCVSIFSGRVTVSWSGFNGGYTDTVHESNCFSITLTGSPATLRDKKYVPMYYRHANHRTQAKIITIHD